MARCYLLDTSTASFIIKGDPAVRRRLVRVPMAQLAISTVTEAELRFGVVRRPEATRLQEVVEEFLLHVAVLPWDSAAASQYAHLRTILEPDGQPIGNLGAMIAAHALSVGATLVTNDRAFRQIEKLKVEDWTKGPQR